MTKIMSWNIELFDEDKITPSNFGTLQTYIYKALDCKVNDIAKDYVSKLWQVVGTTLKLDKVNGGGTQVSAVQLRDEIQTVLDKCLNLTQKASNCVLAAEEEADERKFISNNIYNKLTGDRTIEADAAVGDYLMAAVGLYQSSLKNDGMRKLFQIIFKVIEGYVNDVCKRASGKTEKHKISRDLHREFTKLKATAKILLPAGEDFVLESIIGMIQAVRPDVFVLIEVTDIKDGQAAQHRVLEGPGGLGAVKLLHALRERFEGDDHLKYFMVPPVRLGNCTKDFEGIAVYYNETTLQFSGPSQLPLPGSAAGTYPDLYKTALPPNSTAKLAGQSKFYNGGTQLHFGNTDFRSPFLTQFREIGGQQRILNILSVHNQWDRGQQVVTENTAGINNLAKIAEMTTALGSNIGVIIGDFNADGTDPETFKALTKENYNQLLNAPVPFMQTHLDSRIKWNQPVDEFFNLLLPAAKGENTFPTYNYGGGYDVVYGDKRYGALDNAFVHLPEGGKPPAYILNKFTGSNLSFPQTLGYGKGFLEKADIKSYLASDSINLANQFLKNLGAITADSKREEICRALRSIFSVSDHLPILVEV